MFPIDWFHHDCGTLIFLNFFSHNNITPQLHILPTGRMNAPLHTPRHYFTQLVLCLLFLFVTRKRRADTSHTCTATEENPVSK